MRAASVIGMEPGKLWTTILPIQIFGIILAIGHAALAGLQEKKRGAGIDGRLAAQDPSSAEEAAENATVSELARPKLFWFNLILTAGVIALLIWDVFPSYVPFMLGLCVALFVNYGFSAKMHKRLINLHAGPALMMCSTLMGAAVLMGILTSSMGADGKVISAKVMELPPDALPSVVRCLANMVAGFLPEALGRSLPLVIGVLSVPLALAFDTDSYFYGMLPVVIGIGQAFGVNALPIAVAMVVCRNCATFISPMVPATLLGIGLADIDIKDHIQASFMYVWVFSILCMLFAMVVGIM
jgi:CitMHS family citrate-Mg2+:H+ or citrate-Ca2+:H+ symporter